MKVGVPFLGMLGRNGLMFSSPSKLQPCTFPFETPEPSKTINETHLLDPYTHDIRSRNRHHKSTPFFRRQFLVCVSCKSGTGLVWYQIPTPIRTLFYSKPEADVRMTEMMSYDWLMITAYVLMCFLVVIWSQIKNSSLITSISAMLISAPEIFILDAYGMKNRRQKMELIYGADFWSVRHGYKLTVTSLPVTLLLAGDSWQYLL